MDARWAFLNEFSFARTPSRSWDAAVALVAALREFEAPLRGRLRSVLELSDRSLEEVGGDPLRDTWSVFRPLRLEREEDWSDWLAWLLRTSKTGAFPRRLFRPEMAGCTVANVSREVCVGEYRLDLVIAWSDHERTTIEVKTGDQEFEKTGPATQRYRALFPRGDDFILLPPGDLDACTVPNVQNIGWNDVARSLRACIADFNESLAWRVWARAFVGCIEQKILAFPRVGEVSNIGRVSALLRHMEQHNEA